MFTIIAAIGKNRELGKDGKLIFHIKEDMEFFRDVTMGHMVVMGRKTWESLPGKLPGRENVVISSHDFEGPDDIIHDLDMFIAEYKNNDEEVFIIGGGSIYRTFLPYADKIYLTTVDATDPTADTFFPEFERSQYSQKIIKKGTDNDLSFAISLYQR